MRIGIIGGGQLGMMMAEIACEHGHTIISLDPNPTCSITKYSEIHLAYNFDDLKGIKKLVALCDVLTYEFENVSAKVLRTIEEILPQKIKALTISQNRLLEKSLAVKLSIPTPKMMKLEKETTLFYPSIIKTTTGGYDGIGQHVLRNESDVLQVKLNNNNEYILEELIDFDYEISVIATKDCYGNVVTYPIPINTHRNQVLYTSVVDRNFPKKISSKAIEYTKDIINSLDYIGTLAVEFFVKDDQLIFNEFAPRPHNSGHYTIEGCNVSQFENHILAITKEAVLKPMLLKSTIMVNVLGKDLDFFHKARNLKSVSIHDYNKKVVRPLRKMGHITITKDSLKECTKTLNHILGE